jgi:hypothetical protein
MKLREFIMIKGISTKIKKISNGLYTGVVVLGVVSALTTSVYNTNNINSISKVNTHNFTTIEKSIKANADNLTTIEKSIKAIEASINKKSTKVSEKTNKHVESKKSTYDINLNLITQAEKQYLNNKLSEEKFYEKLKIAYPEFETISKGLHYSSNTDLKKTDAIVAGTLLFIASNSSSDYKTFSSKMHGPNINKEVFELTKFMSALIRKESGGKSKNVVNQYGYVGLTQIGLTTLYESIFNLEKKGYTNNYSNSLTDKEKSYIKKYKNNSWKLKDFFSKKILKISKEIYKNKSSADFSSKMSYWGIHKRLYRNFITGVDNALKYNKAMGIKLTKGETYLKVYNLLDNLTNSKSISQQIKYSLEIIQHKINTKKGLKNLSKKSNEEAYASLYQYYNAEPNGMAKKHAKAVKVFLTKQQLILKFFLKQQKQIILILNKIN